MEKVIGVFAETQNIPNLINEALESLPSDNFIEPNTPSKQTRKFNNQWRKKKKWIEKST